MFYYRVIIDIMSPNQVNKMFLFHKYIKIVVSMWVFCKLLYKG